MTMILLCLAAWLIIGAFGFIYWWTKDEDLTNNEVVLIVGGALAGPLARIVGYTIHGVSEDAGSRVIFKKRKK